MGTTKRMYYVFTFPPWMVGSHWIVTRDVIRCRRRQIIINFKIHRKSVLLRRSSSGSRSITANRSRYGNSVIELISRVPSVSCATRLKLSICLLIFFIREYLPNRWTYLNKSLHGDGNWLGIEYGGFEFLRGVRLGAKNVTFCQDLPGVTFTKYNMAPKRRKISKIENSLVLAR